MLPLPAAVRTPIGELPDAFLSRGLHAFTTREAAEAAAISVDSARPALARLVRKNLAFSPARGLYVLVPPEYRTWGAVPAEWFIDPLMKFMGRSYYVGFLSAAEVHGASHQRPQVFQVVTDRVVRDRSFGRVHLRFVTNCRTAELPLEIRNTPTGTMNVSAAELTALDLAHRPEYGGAIHNVATVLIDLATDGKLMDDILADLVAKFPASAGRRVGWIIENFAGIRLEDTAAALSQMDAAPSLLDPFGARRGKVDERWRLRVNTEIAPDLETLQEVTLTAYVQKPYDSATKCTYELEIP